MNSSKARNPKQLKLQEKTPRKNTKAFIVHTNLGYGGEISYRKVKRPFSNQGSTHTVLRSRHLSGSRSLLKNNRKVLVEKIIRAKVRKYFGSLYELSVNSNHIHMLTQFKNEKLQAHFFRDLTGMLAKKLRALLKITDPTFWDSRPFTRLYQSSAFQVIRNYIRKNTFEAAGLIRYMPRPISRLSEMLENLQASRERSHSRNHAERLRDLSFSIQNSS